MNATAYVRLRDARSLHHRSRKVTIGGVIVEFGIPKESRGTDYFCHLKLVDDSHAGRRGAPVTIFENELEKLPFVAFAGDILLLSNVTMKEHENEVYAVYNKKFSSFALYRGKDCQDFIPYQISSRFSANEDDKLQVARLRYWFADFRLSEESTKFHTLADMVESANKHVNLVCKVLYTFETAEGAWVFLWDGTDAPSKRINTRLQREVDKPLPLHLESMVVPQHILCSFPTIGTILRVFFDRTYWKLISHWMKSCTWMKFMHVKCTGRAGLWTVVTSSLRFRYTVNEERIVLCRQRKFELRESLNLGRMPNSCLPYPTLITVVDHHSVGFSTLMDVLTHKEVTAKFKCIVRFVAALSLNIPSLTPQGHYLFRFTVEDPTARLRAYAYAEDAEMFFGTHALGDILWKLRKLLGVASEGNEGARAGVGRNPPWVRCCLKSYYTDKNDMWGSRRYRIFDTQLVGGEDIDYFV